MKRCKVCRKKPTIERRVNSEGVLFCSTDCYEEWEHPADDCDHPYVNDYEMIRLDYIKWAKNYIVRLYEGFIYGYPSPRYLLEELDEVVEAYYQYRLLEGRDGIYSEEIHTYLLKFGELRAAIQSWKVEDHQNKRLFKAMERERNARWTKAKEELEARWLEEA
ncbi:hypothetical protein JOD03_001315 [Chryseomicrobium aureum]|uniref:hypothetical protein n=1 Tax=Chryseomicrobium aureum TaxID=1441723 RepID=UPI0019574FAA|nr:hypothetical protein [Chryseomicrobium aureum]MBM7706412.1 hypothetical protein [Chryseomicrobium aureum]